MADSPMGTVIVAVGDEILGGFTLDTNSHWLAGQLREAGYPCARIEVVPDRTGAIVSAVRTAVDDPAAARVMVCGGLGPTPDDRTLEALAIALDRPLEVHPDAERHVQRVVDRLHAAGWIDSDRMTEPNRRMTVVPSGATVHTNRSGMAPGLAYPLPAAGGTERWLMALPGVPRELKRLFTEEMLPTYFVGGAAPVVVELRYRHAVEAEFFEPMRRLEREFPDVLVGSYPQTETRELVIRVRGADAERVEAALNRMRELRPQL
ncbi:MAG TPA: molybdopterin-binding protein [Candidatus Dormibacteraeota bacterium]|jgi:molybdenum cofactor synthesis domain-containing protein|nr:molybdopterin-binding protein [Candidatus Dormibacteraeota bacterium]